MWDLNAQGVCKEKIIKLLMDNELIVKLLNPIENPLVEDIKDILYPKNVIEVDGKIINEQGYIFDHFFVEDATLEAKTVIMVDTSIGYMPHDVLGWFVLEVYVVSNNDTVQLNNISNPTYNYMRKLGYHGNRVDMLCTLINEVVSKANIGSNAMTIRTDNQSPLTIHVPKVGWYGKKIRYIVTTNEIENEGCDN